MDILCTLDERKADPSRHGDAHASVVVLAARRRRRSPLPMTLAMLFSVFSVVIRVPLASLMVALSRRRVRLPRFTLSSLGSAPFRSPIARKSAQIALSAFSIALSMLFNLFFGVLALDSGPQ